MLRHAADRPTPPHGAGPGPEGERPDGLDRLRRARDAVRRAFREFLAVPTSVITAFLALAVLLDAADRATPSWLQPTRQFLQQHVFIDARTTSEVLSAIAAGIITVTSITVSVLLLAVQQSAASMSTAVFDQFLRRRANQLSFGYFIGLGLCTLVTLATVHEHANAVLGASLCVLSTVVALYVLLVLLYSTVDQMRPSAVLGSISHLTLQARRGQAELLARTRRRSATDLPVAERVRVTSSGYVTHIDLPALERALAPRATEVEVVLLVSLGSFVAYGDVVAELRRAGDVECGADAGGVGRKPHDQGRKTLSDVVRGALHLEADRDIGGDPAYGVEQIHTIGWTSISSAKSNPAPGLFAIRTLRDLLARWAEEGKRLAASAADASDDRSADRAPWAGRKLPVVYTDDTTDRAFGALESLGVAASESKQHQALAEVLRAVGALVELLPDEQRYRAAAVVERLLPSLQNHIRTQLLDDALANTADALESAGEHDAAMRVRAERRRWNPGHGASARPPRSMRSLDARG